MSRLSLALALVSIGLGAGCSHQQDAVKVARPTPTPVRVAARPAAPAPVAAAAPAAPVRPDDAIYFDFDSSLLRDDARPVLQSVAALVRQRPGTVRVEGNCDELGTIEYNLALGEARARAAKDYLARLGVPDREIVTVSYGSQRPRFTGHDETAHAKNRRDDLMLRR
jgi:peptidoglycan-associated lipoprotein